GFDLAMPSVRHRTGRVGGVLANASTAWKLLAKLAAYNADAQPFDGQLLMLQVDFNGCEVGIFSQQPNLAAFAFEAFDGDFIVQAGDDDLPVACLTGDVHCK